MDTAAIIKTLDLVITSKRTPTRRRDGRAGVDA